ncbi:hypothetical protein Slin15195_G123460 [Septoria linicola]|uniref:Nephrocystin 3-like N-terminal domain-containing protein n=1 Tax=Septoria linicola TaxID=215465 RepID=A0A9Q9EQP4_9PEZI|nr:hypothetical protein Slin14017_G079660 [Septoria linicola]USW59027.1 hypothetical protein Slin15195_G123460 [Septoria linicola]
MLARIIFQWAQSSPEYAKAVAAVCARSNALSKALPMWYALVTDLVNTISGTYFIVIDGYERDEDEDDATAYEAMQSLVNSCASSNSRIRLFLSGGEDDIVQLTPLREQRPGMVVTGSGLMPRRDWLNKLRAEWGLQQEAIDAHKELEQQKRDAARFIAKALTQAKRKKMALVVEQVQARKAVGVARSGS